MFSKTILVILTVLVLTTLACGITFDLPVTEVKTGPTETEEINIPLLDPLEEVAKVTLGFGAGELILSPSAEAVLITGTATYNVADFKPEITIEGNEVAIETGDLEIKGIPNFRDKYRNEWNLQFGAAPMELTINAGAYKGDFELGGLSLRSLKVADGAADVHVNFAELNPIEMDVFRYDSGASSVELSGLANANFDELIFKGGAGDYTLEFSGELKRDANVSIDSGLSNVEIIVPQGVSARVFVDSGLANVDIQGDWEKSGNEYTLDGEGPRITINVNIGAGNLELRNR